MMKKYCFSLLLLVAVMSFKYLPAQTNLVQSKSSNVKDTNEVWRLIIIAAGDYRFTKPDSSIILAWEALTLSRQLNFKSGEAASLTNIGEGYRIIGDFPRALDFLFQGLQLCKEIEDKDGEATTLGFIGLSYSELGEYRQGLSYLFQAKDIFERHSKSATLEVYNFCLTNIGDAYEKLNLFDSAIYYNQKAFEAYPAIKAKHNKPLQSDILMQLANVEYRLKNYDKALRYYHEVIDLKSLLHIGVVQTRIAEYFFNVRKENDSSLFYALQAYHNSEKSFQKVVLFQACELLGKIYKERNKVDSGYYYYALATSIKDSVFGAKQFHKLQLLAVNQQQRQQEIIQEKENFKNNVRLYFLLGIVAIVMLLAIVFYRNNKRKQRINKKLEDTLDNLKATQSQLIQSEKMASLGELTAGIAHEIQNPLNFVNNFSEVNRELIGEMKTELEKGNLEEVMVLANDIETNEKKINHHGKRADAIVKGMLQHSRTSSGQKEPTDINALCDEYLRLAYHGLRAKDKSFNALLETNFDTSVGKINIVPQDIGRVVLNLINNAFYTVDEKKKTGIDGYEPTVTVSTSKQNSKIEIKVKDNGSGIPQKILDKIFQPFFTTKPTGQGTGLGLSLAYDIVTKGHGGELRVETKEGEGSEFILKLPI